MHLHLAVVMIYVSQGVMNWHSNWHSYFEFLQHFLSVKLIELVEGLESLLRFKNNKDFGIEYNIKTNKLI